MHQLEIPIADIAEKFGLTIVGDSRAIVNQLGSTKRKGNRSFYWAKTKVFLESISSGTVLCGVEIFKEAKIQSSVTVLLASDSPRLTFSKIISEYFVPDVFEDESNYVADHRQNGTLKIGENVFIGKNVEIGNGTQIQNNVVIRQNVKIGKNCLIKDNTTIGTEGLSHDYDEVQDLYFKLPQIGGVIIDDYVEIGPNSTVRRAALDDTIVGRGTRIGSLCNIGHNVVIGKNCTFISHGIAGGSSVYGDNVFVGMGASIKHGMNIGNNATIGQGSVVVKHVPEGETWVGNPAKKIER
jgi:UDP-3-O-[3-hydroxymyristoyl] glucosamine N-acyltransferase